MKSDDAARENKVIVRRFYEEVFDRGNISTIDEPFAPGKEAGLGEVSLMQQLGVVDPRAAAS